MECSKCISETAPIKADYYCISKVIGQVMVPMAEFYYCSACGTRQLAPDEEQRVATYLERLEDQAVGSLPADRFVSAGQAAETFLNLAQVYLQHELLLESLRELESARRIIGKAKSSEVPFSFDERSLDR